MNSVTPLSGATEGGSHGFWLKEKRHVTLWEVDIHPAPGRPDHLAAQVANEAVELGLPGHLSVRTARVFLLEGELHGDQIRQIAAELLTDAVVEVAHVGQIGDPQLQAPANVDTRLVHVLPKPGVTDPVAQSTSRALADLGMPVRAVRTGRKFWLTGITDQQLELLCDKVLANESVDQVVFGPLMLDRLDTGSDYVFERITVALGALDDAALERLSRERQLHLSLVEMHTVRNHFRQLGRDPTDVELETVAQTWSEHCSHKTLKSRIVYDDETGSRVFGNLLAETVFAATQQIRTRLGGDDWCVSVFEDNAGIVKFDEKYHAVFKVETHNHPSAIEPYGGANTGIGGVIRDPLGTGLGAKPVCNTNVFCFAPLDLHHKEIATGVLHPRRVFKGVVAGVRDYGNRMGIPTVNGAIFFDRRYLGNPLVYCGTVAILPVAKSAKRPLAGDYVVLVGGKTGRDGIHGATFSSAELTSESDSISGGAVQIGNAITEKMMLDVLLVARDRGLYHAITDCGAGGLSSAVGEMGQALGAEVWLDRVPLKYAGLSYAETWISEAQERMVLAVPPDAWDELNQLCASENVEATVVGRFTGTGQLRLSYHGQEVADLSMEFLHQGRPTLTRQATYRATANRPLPNSLLESARRCCPDILRRILASPNVASKEWVIRQYDHEVQGGSVIKPLVGVASDGPSDAAVLRPRLDSFRGLAVSCGMNPHFGDLDTYCMAASAIDEAVRNCVAVGADPSRIAILDNFCWGNTQCPETLGALVRAALACHDVAVGLSTPFISGKDSLNNLFTFQDTEGQKRSIGIPPSLLISALGQIADVRRCVTMDFKRPGNVIFSVGLTKAELGGSHFNLVSGIAARGDVPRVDVQAARHIFTAMHQAIEKGLVCACHDLSEGGLAVGLAEMAFAGDLGADVWLSQLPADIPTGIAPDPVLLFSESNSRFLCEVWQDRQDEMRTLLGDLPHAPIGAVTDRPQLRIFGVEDDGAGSMAPVVDASLPSLKRAWQEPLELVMK
jgi:phosphoribosylformylglycinamidine synthase